MSRIIETWSEFILNETLLTRDIDLVVRMCKSELSLLNFNFNISKIDNTISIKLIGFRYLNGCGLYLDTLNELMINRCGWFPSRMIITNFTNMKNEFPYDEDKLKNDGKYYQDVEVIFEPKYDIQKEIPDKLYHISIQEYLNNVTKSGLIPKSKSKISNHLDRIYVCSDISHCRNLISRMKFYYFNRKSNNKKDTVNDKWVIYEIDSSGLNINLYRDPNYSDGFYIVDNIPPERIKIIEKEN